MYKLQGYDSDVEMSEEGGSNRVPNAGADGVVMIDTTEGGGAFSEVTPNVDAKLFSGVVSTSTNISRKRVASKVNHLHADTAKELDKDVGAKPEEPRERSAFDSDDDEDDVGADEEEGKAPRKIAASDPESDYDDGNDHSEQNKEQQKQRQRLPRPLIRALYKLTNAWQEELPGGKVWKAWQTGNAVLIGDHPIATIRRYASRYIKQFAQKDEQKKKEDRQTGVQMIAAKGCTAEKIAAVLNNAKNNEGTGKLPQMQQKIHEYILKAIEDGFNDTQKADISNFYDELTVMKQIDLFKSMSTDKSLFYNWDESWNPLLIIRSFLILGSTDPGFLTRDYALMLNIILPALNKIEEDLPIFDEPENVCRLVAAIINYYQCFYLPQVGEKDAVVALVPKQVFELANQVGALHAMVEALKGHFERFAETKMGFKEYLEGLRLHPKAAQLIFENPGKLAFSGFINQCAENAISYDRHESICKTASQLQTMDGDPSEFLSIIYRVCITQHVLQSVINKATLNCFSAEKLANLLERFQKLEDPGKVKDILRYKPDKWEGLLRSAVQEEKFMPTSLNDDACFNILTRENYLLTWLYLVKVRGIQHQNGITTNSRVKPNKEQNLLVCKIIEDQTKNRVTLLQMPAGTGKSGVAILLGTLMHSLGAKPAIVTSSEVLKHQYVGLMGSALTSDVPAVTMDEVLPLMHKYSVFIVDEADECILNLGSEWSQNKHKLCGCWEMLQKRVILLTASVNDQLIEVVKTFYNKDFKVMVRSEIFGKVSEDKKYEYTYRHCPDDDMLLDAIVEMYKSKPVIVFVDSADSGKQMAKVLCDRLDKVPFQKAPAVYYANDEAIMLAQRAISFCGTGIAIMLPKYGRGVDFRFEAPAHVFITFVVESKNELVQMIGRSNRELSGTHEGTVMADLPPKLIGKSPKEIVRMLKDGAANIAGGIQAALALMALENGADGPIGELSHTKFQKVYGKHCRGWQNAKPLSVVGAVKPHIKSKEVLSKIIDRARELIAQNYTTTCSKDARDNFTQVLRSTLQVATKQELGGALSAVY